MVNVALLTTTVTAGAKRLLIATGPAAFQAVMPNRITKILAQILITHINL
jgi:hypothetical protein